MNTLFMYFKYGVLILIVVVGEHRVFAQQVDVQTFVRQTFVHGVPYARASQYGAADATLLLQMLSDENEIAHRTNIVVTLAMIGDERAVEPLINLVTSGASGTLSASEYSVKTSALISLGYLVNKTNSIRALTYLTEGLRLDIWRNRNLIWASPFHTSADERNQQLISLSIIGLALSGHALAREALVAFQLVHTLNASERALVEEALRAHAVISSQGLAEYYRQSEM